MTDQDKLLPEHVSAIREAVLYNNLKWPKELTSGIMFYNGFRITIAEFNKVKKELS